MPASLAKKLEREIVPRLWLGRLIGPHTMLDSLCPSARCLDAEKTPRSVLKWIQMRLRFALRQEREGKGRLKRQAETGVCTIIIYTCRTRDELAPLSGARFLCPLSQHLIAHCLNCGLWHCI